MNLKFIIEGEEEVGGGAVDKYVGENPEKLQADVVLVSDTEMFAPGLPTLCVGLRGLVYTEIIVHGSGARPALGPLRRRRAQSDCRAQPDPLSVGLAGRPRHRCRVSTTTVDAVRAQEKILVGAAAVRREEISGEGSRLIRP